MKAPHTPSARLPELDMLRGLAALSIVFYHFVERYDVLFHHTRPPALRWTHGYYGVQLFFMISGWVIPLAAERAQDAGRFAWARFTRLFPTYWVVGLITLTLVSLIGLPGRDIPWWHSVVNVTMLQEYFDLRNIDGTYWSLQAELTFYLLVLLMVGLGKLRWLGVALLGWVAFGLAYEPLLRSITPAHAPTLIRHLERIFILEWMHLFGLGYVFYRMSRGHRFGPVCLGLIVLGLWRQTEVSLPWSVWLLVGYGVVFRMVMAGWLRFAAWRPLLALGAMSYPLYLIHSNPGYLVIRALESRGVPPEAAIAVAVALALVAAYALSRAIEYPARRWLLAHPPSAEGLAGALAGLRTAWARLGRATGGDAQPAAASPTSLDLGSSHDGGLVPAPIGHYPESRASRRRKGAPDRRSRSV